MDVVGGIGGVPADDWDACAGPGNPFVGHAFLSALEGSGAACAGSGWRPCHLVARDSTGRVHGTMPLYLKSHSWGEYVFDWGWAEAWQRAGGRYYPKLQCAVPFTPVTGPRLLLRPDAPPGVFAELAGAAVRLAERLRVSSLHVTFPTGAEAKALEEHGFMSRLGHQYHWENRGYSSFEDFLNGLASRKRKAIRRERREVAESGIVIRGLTGGGIEERHWAAFHRFYMDTVERKWAHAYLDLPFFLRLGETMADRVLLVMAETPAGEPVGGALNLIGHDAIYGRYWGCSQAYRFLHFEVCYYRAIEFAIERGFGRVEAGAQGEHKVQRGYLPEPTWSAHWIAAGPLRRGVERFLEAERTTVESEMAALAAQSPFRKAGED